MRKLILASGIVVAVGGLASWYYWPILICCNTDGTDCYPVDAAGDCPAEGRFVSECACPTTLPDGSTDCRC